MKNDQCLLEKVYEEKILNEGILSRLGLIRINRQEVSSKNK